MAVQRQHFDGVRVGVGFVEFGEFFEGGAHCSPAIPMFLPRLTRGVFPRVAENSFATAVRWRGLLAKGLRFARPEWRSARATRRGGGGTD